MSQRPDSDQEMPLVSHLTELRTRLLRIVAAVFALFAGLFYFSQDIYALVAAPLRGHGVGSALLLHATSCSAGARLFTSTNQSNASMQRLLAATGFQQCGIVHGLDEGDPELIYRFATDDVR